MNLITKDGSPVTPFTKLEDLKEWSEPIYEICGCGIRTTNPHGICSRCKSDLDSGK